MYNYSDMEVLTNILVGLGAFLLVIGLIVLVFAILQIIGQWKAFVKAGKGGWESLIPYYRDVVACQIAGVSPWWVLIVVLSPILNVVPIVGSLLYLAVMIYYLVLVNVSLARSFGKSDGFAAGLVFLAPIFWLILGGKNTAYEGQKPMKDIVFNYANDKVFNNNNGSANTTYPNNAAATNNAGVDRFCANCGAKVSNGERFCPSCGQEVK